MYGVCCSIRLLLSDGAYGAQCTMVSYFNKGTPKWQPFTNGVYVQQSIQGKYKYIDLSFNCT